MTGKAKRFCNLFHLLTRLLTNHESFVFSLQSVVSDGFVQCVWEVTFESKSGNVHAIEVAKAKSGSDGFSTLATLNSGNKVTDTDYIMTGTTIPISCDFRLQFDGEATGYMQHEMKAASFCINPLSDPAVRLCPARFWC